MTRPLTILYAEDEENDIFFLGRAFKLAGSPHTVMAVPDGAQALEYLAKTCPCRFYRTAMMQ